MKKKSNRLCLVWGVLAVCIVAFAACRLSGEVGRAAAEDPPPWTLSISATIDHLDVVASAQARKPAHPLIGPGQGTAQGVDHLGIAIRDFKKNKEDYEQVLGFKVKEATQPNGWPQASIPFENGTYLEFQPIAALPWIAEMFNYTDGYADFAEKYEGAVFLGLATSSAKVAADHLKACNFQASLVEDDPFNYVHISHEPSGEKQAFLLALFFIEYFFDPGRPARFAARLEQGLMTHPNTARRLYSVWFAVCDL